MNLEQKHFLRSNLQYAIGCLVGTTDPGAKHCVRFLRRIIASLDFVPDGPSSPYPPGLPPAPPERVAPPRPTKSEPRREQDPFVRFRRFDDEYSGFAGTSELVRIDREGNILLFDREGNPWGLPFGALMSILAKHGVKAIDNRPTMEQLRAGLRDVIDNWGMIETALQATITFQSLLETETGQALLDRHMQHLVRGSK